MVKNTHLITMELKLLPVEKLFSSGLMEIHLLVFHQQQIAMEMNIPLDGE